MKRILALWIIALLASCCAGAEPVLPEGPVLPEEARQIGGEAIGPIRRIDLEIPSTGERMALFLDGDGEPLTLVTVADGAPASEAAGDVTAAAEEACPGALVLRSSGEQLAVASYCWFGTLEVRSGCVVRRELRGGRFVGEDGLLTLDGALAAMRLLRPEAVFQEIEYDADDRDYEGEALVDGEPYEFEIDAASGRLLEWERD